MPMTSFDKAVEKKMKELSAEPTFEGPGSMEMLARRAKSEAAGVEEKAKAMEKGAAMREQTKPGSMQSKTGMGPAKK